MLEEKSSEKDQLLISDLKKQVHILELLNKEYSQKIEKIKSSSEISEDKFSSSQSYKLLVSQA